MLTNKLSAARRVYTAVMRALLLLALTISANQISRGRWAGRLVFFSRRKQVS